MDDGNRATGNRESIDAERSLALLRAIFGASPEPIGVVSQGRIYFANQALVQLHGYSGEHELIGKHAIMLVAQPWQPQVLELIRRRAAGDPVPPVHRVGAVRSDGTGFTAEVRNTTFELGGRSYSLLGVRDATELERLEQLQRQNSELYRAIFEVNTAVKLLIDPSDGRIVAANAAAVEFYGWPRGQLEQMRINDINVLTDEEIQAEMRAANSGRRRYFRFRHRTANGQIRHVEVHSGPLSLDGAELLLSIVHDVTERDELAAELDRSRRLEAIGRLAGGVAHDFNNLLTVVMSSAQLLSRTVTQKPGLADDCIADILRASERAAELTRKLLAFSRRQIMHTEPVQVSAVIANVCEILERTLGPRIELVRAIEADLPPALTDRGKLEQVLMNVALNARDAMPEGGVLELSARRRCAGEEGQDCVELAVTDSGIGMDEGTRAHAFDPFFTTKNTSHSAGLGLATAYGVVTQSGGTIAVQSAPGQGTTVTIQLPIAAAEAPSAPRRVVASSKSAGRRILLVDDTSEVRCALSQSLRAEGYVVLEASSAAEALERADKASFDVLVSDVVMPGLSGIELARQLLSARPELPVLLISGDLRHHDLALPGGVEFLQKPFDAPRLIARIESLLTKT